jgi:hypothetical protein
VTTIEVTVTTEGTYQEVALFLPFLYVKAARLKIPAEMLPLQSQVPVKFLITPVFATEINFFARRLC